MANYFYTDADGNKRGPYNEQHLQELVTRGLIGPNTPLENDTGHKGRMWEFPDLNGANAQRTSLNTPDTSYEQMSPSLFDFGFTRFVTNTWISIIWALTIVLTFLGCVGAMVFGASNNVPALFIIAPITAALFLLFMRMAFEVTIVLFRIETHLRTIREQNENK